MNRFSTEQEILNALEPIRNGSGPVLYEKNGVYYGLSADTEKHVLVSGATRSGKTSRSSINMAFSVANSQNDSAIIVDSGRKDIYKAIAGYALKRRTHKVYHLDLTTWESPDSYNPLLSIFSQLSDVNPSVQDQGYRNIEQFGRILVADQGHDDHYWEESGAQFISGLLLCLCELATEDAEINLNSLQALCSEALRKVGGKTVLDGLLEILPPESKAVPYLSMVADSASQTAGSIFSVAISAINKLCIGDMIMDTFNDPAPSITLKALEHRPFMLFISLPEDGEAAIGVVVLAQLLNHFIQLADTSKSGRLDNNLHIILEEIGVVGPYLKRDLPRYTSTCLGRNIRFTMICQSTAQLDHIFGTEGTRVIRSNSGAHLYFADYDFSACEQISRMCGSYPLFTPDVPNGVIEAARIRPENVRGLSVGEALIVCGKLIYVTKLPLYTRLFVPEMWETDPLPFHFREYAQTLHPLVLAEQKRKADLDELQRQINEAHKAHMREYAKKHPPASEKPNLMDIPRGVEIAYRQRQIQTICSKPEHTSTTKPNPGLWARAVQLFRNGTVRKEDTQ